MTCSATRGPAVVSAFHDNIDLVVGGGSGFGCDEPVVRRIEVKPESIANSPSVYVTTWDGIAAGDRTVRVHSNHLTIGGGRLLSTSVIVEFADLGVEHSVWTEFDVTTVMIDAVWHRAG